MSKVRSGWDAALEWAARMIETGYPEGAERPSPVALAMTLRAKKNDVDLQLLGEAAAAEAWRRVKGASSSPDPRRKPEQAAVDGAERDGGEG